MSYKVQKFEGRSTENKRKKLDHIWMKKFQRLARNLPYKYHLLDVPTCHTVLKTFHTDNVM